MDIVVLDGFTENPGDLSWEGLAQFGKLTVYDRTPADKVVERIGNAKAVFTNKTPILADTIKQCPGLEYIGVLATGYNNIDIVAARDRAILVSNIPAYGTDSVAQYTIALLLELCHHIGEHSECVKAGEWTNNQDWCFWKHPLVELAGKTFGIIGLGRIGRRTAEIAHALGMTVLACDEYPNKICKGVMVQYVSLEELFACADVISLHCPLLPSTQGMINRHTIAKMKDGVKIINTSRGSLIVEDDLKEALDNGKVSGAAVDVVSTEPINKDNPLLTARNIIITPHIAWAPRESRQRLMMTAVENLRQYINGKPQNIVN